MIRSPSPSQPTLLSMLLRRRWQPLAAGAFTLAMLCTQAQAAPVAVNIPSQPLGNALVALGQQSGLQILYQSDLVNGLRAPAVQGEMEPTVALQRLLDGTGVRYSVSDGVVNLYRTDDNALTLPNTNINSVGVQSVTAPMEGVVATRSAVGTKTNTAISEVPQSISVITRDEMDKRGVQDFNSAVAYTPGIRAVDYAGGQGAPDIYLRGFRSFNLFGIYKDGLRSGFNQYDTDFETYGLERLDVIKGPASVLYGQMAPGGMVNLTSKRPTDEPIHEIQIQGGSFDRKQGAIDLGGRLDDEGKFTYRLVALKRDSGTQVDHSPDDRTYVAPALTWKPDDDTSFTVLASYLKTRKGGAEQSFPVNGTLTNTPYGHIPSSTYLGDPHVSKYEVENTSLATSSSAN